MPTISITVGTDSATGRGGFFISGGGFSAGGTVSVFYDYHNSDVDTSNSGSPATLNVDADGNLVPGIIDVSTLVDDGDLFVKAVDDLDVGFYAVDARHWDGTAWVPVPVG